MVQESFAFRSSTPFGFSFCKLMRGVSVVTRPVSVLDTLFRSTHKISQNSFESSLFAKIQQNPNKALALFGLWYLRRRTRNFSPYGSSTPFGYFVRKLQNTSKAFRILRNSPPDCCSLLRARK